VPLAASDPVAAFLRILLIRRSDAVGTQKAINKNGITGKNAVLPATLNKLSIFIRAPSCEDGI
jgi:hypothetical protein